MPHPQHPPPRSPERRTFLDVITAFLGAAAALVFAIPFVGYLLGPLFKKRNNGKDLWIPLGPLSDFPVNVTRLRTFDNDKLAQPWDGMVAHTAVYVCKLSDEARPRFRVLAVYCAHLGCPVSWFPQSGLFMCPCHGGAYYSDGERASGPPERGLFVYPSTVKDGVLSIQAGELPTPGAAAAFLKG